MKLIWGCMFFYPTFYVVGIFPLITALPLSPAAALACGALFVAGWMLTRGANLQKFACKRAACFKDAAGALWWGRLVSMETLSGSGGRILVGGFWGASRHINYLGEICQAIALSLPGVLAGASLVPLLYPLYYVLLFVPRAQDDDEVCRKKYGDKLWDAYTKRVPSRIVPGVW